MGQMPYAYERDELCRYKFLSTEKLSIEKVVKFDTTALPDIFNMEFGDLMADGSIDDTANSNNGDMAQVLATLVAILKDFLFQYPDATVYFKGSTLSRMKLYNRILKTHHKMFTREYIITAYIDDNSILYDEVVYDPNMTKNYEGFLIKRNR